MPRVLFQQFANSTFEIVSFTSLFFLRYQITVHYDGDNDDDDNIDAFDDSVMMVEVQL